MFDATSRAIELYEFGCISKKELAPQLCCSVCKSCCLDPMPGCILKNYNYQLLRELPIFRYTNSCNALRSQRSSTET